MEPVLGLGVRDAVDPDHSAPVRHMPPRGQVAVRAHDDGATIHTGCTSMALFQSLVPLPKWTRMSVE